MTTPVVYSMMFNGIFPCFEGFNQFAIWPAAQQVVSFPFALQKKLTKHVIFFRIRLTILFYLKKKIFDPQLQRSSVTLPFYEGYQYAAFPAQNIDQVIK